MPAQEHVHIIAAGDDLPVTYTASFRDYPGITRTYVFTDDTVYFRHADPGIEKPRLAIRNAVSSAKNTSTALGIPFSNVIVSAPTHPAVRDAITRIHREYPRARYTFDLSGGSKALCMALLSLAPWVNGEVRAVFDEKVLCPVPHPDRPLAAMLANPNYQTILALLVKYGKKNEGSTTPAPVSRQYIYQQLLPLYTMMRAKKEIKPDQPEMVSCRVGSRPADELTQGTLSGFMSALIDAGLAEEIIPPESRRTKYYRITERGEYAFRFYSDPGSGTLVQTVLENV